MRTRILVGIALALMLITILYFGGMVFFVMITLFSLAAVYEMGRAFRNKEYHPMLIPAYVFAASYVFVYNYIGIAEVIMLFLISITVTIMICMFSKKFQVPDAIISLFIHIYPLLFLVCMMLVYCSFDRPIGLTAACLAYAGPSCADAFAYFGGTFFGKHKLCPDISPKKTVEGSAFAVLGGVVFGALMIPLQTLWGSNINFGLLLFLGLACGIFSQIGDLFASYIKRWVGVKDFSSVFPGHGGIMDRIDSILICSPIVLGCFAIARLMRI